MIASRVEKIVQSARHPRRDISPDVQRAIEHIELMISRGYISSGQKLVETELGQQIGVGRGRIREALRILAGEGVVMLTANRGAHVRKLSAQQLAWGAEAAGGIIHTGLQLFLRCQHDIPNTIDKELTLVARKIPKTKGVFATIHRITDYQLIINYYSGNRYLNRLVSGIHRSHHSIELSKYITEDDLDNMVSIHARLHTFVLQRSNAAIAEHQKIIDITVNRLKTAHHEDILQSA